MLNFRLILVGGYVVEPISESTPQMNFSLMRASSDNQRQWRGQRGNDKEDKYNKDGNLLSEITDVVVVFGLQLDGRCR